MSSKKFILLLSLIFIGLSFVQYKENFHLSASNEEIIVSNSSRDTLYLHKTLVNSFAKGFSGNKLEFGKLPNSPIFPEERIYYSFLPSFYEASLIIAGKICERKKFICKFVLIFV